MAAADYVLMTVECAGSPPRLEDAALALGVPVSALDTGFGIIQIDPSKNLCAVQVLASAVPKTKDAGNFKGPFANPRIETFGPPKSDKE
jgi:hypothetical protein